jgi:hypothetical protein
MLPWFECSIVLKKFAESVYELCLGVDFLFERFDTELKMHIKCSISNGNGDFGGQFNLHALDLVVFDMNAVFFLLHE